MERNCILWGIQVVIPGNCRSKMLEDLNCEHAGMTRMKAISRSCFSPEVSLSMKADASYPSFVAHIVYPLP